MSIPVEAASALPDSSTTKVAPQLPRAEEGDQKVSPISQQERHQEAKVATSSLFSTKKMESWQHKLLSSWLDDLHEVFPAESSTVIAEFRALLGRFVCDEVLTESEFWAAAQRLLVHAQLIASLQECVANTKELAAASDLQSAAAAAQPFPADAPAAAAPKRPRRAAAVRVPSGQEEGGQKLDSPASSHPLKLGPREARLLLGLAPISGPGADLPAPIGHSAAGTAASAEPLGDRAAGGAVAGAQDGQTYGVKDWAAPSLGLSWAAVSPASSSDAREAEWKQHARELAEHELWRQLPAAVAGHRSPGLFMPPPSPPRVPPPPLPSPMPPPNAPQAPLTVMSQATPMPLHAPSFHYLSKLQEATMGAALDQGPPRA